LIIKLKREPSNAECTFGVLTTSCGFKCHTLEDIVRPTKIKGQTAIPAGKYQVVVTMSPRFKRELPLLLAVPGFEGIRIHPGNYATDTEGCILPGMSRGQTKGRFAVLNSRKAFDELYVRILAAIKRGEKVEIEIC